LNDSFPGDISKSFLRVANFFEEKEYEGFDRIGFRRFDSVDIGRV